MSDARETTTARMIDITTTHALHGSVGFTADAATGIVHKIQVNVREFGDPPLKFAVAEYVNHYGHLPAVIDVLDIGYITFGNEQVEPDPDFRRERAAARLKEAEASLLQLTVALRALSTNDVISVGALTSQQPAVKQALQASVEYLRRWGFLA